jgi:hypothetical protein
MLKRTVSKRGPAYCLYPTCPQLNDSFLVSYDVEETYDPTTDIKTTLVRGIRDAGSTTPVFTPTERTAVITRHCPWCDADRPVRVEY